MNRNDPVPTQPGSETDHLHSNHEEFDKQQRDGLASRSDRNIEPLPSLDHFWPQLEGRVAELDDLLMLERTEQLLTHCVFTLLLVSNSP